MIAEMVLGLLLFAAVITFPIYVLLRLARHNREIADLRHEIRRLREGRPEAPAPRVAPAPEPAAEPALPPLPPMAPPAPAPPLVAGVREKPLQPAPTPAPARPAVEIDWESLLGANWLSKLGVVALAVAAGFFLKYAFESGWIGPQARVAIGLVSGGVLLALGQWLLAKPRYHAYAQVLMSGGVVILFLSVYAAYNFYRLLGFTEAFAAMALAAMAASALATANNTQGVAMLCLLGAFFTPVLIQSEGVGPSDLSRLYVYLTALNIWALVLVRSRAWYSLIVLSFAATWLIFFGSQPGRKLDFALFEVFAALFLLFACYGGMSAVTKEKEPSPNLTWIALGVIGAGCLAFAIVSVQILADSYLLGLPSLVMAGTFLALLLVGMAVALPTLPAHDAAVRQLLVFLSADAMALLVVAAIYAAPSVERALALPGFVFVVVSYVVFLLAVLLRPRREPGRAALVALVLVNAASHAVASLHVLAPLKLWSISAGVVWLPVAGWLTLLFSYLASDDAEGRAGLRKAVLLAAQGLPIVALIAAVGRGSGWPVGRGLAIWWLEFLLLSATWLAMRPRMRPAGMRADLLAAFTNAAAFFGLMAVTARMESYQGLVILCGCAVAMGVYHALIGSSVLRRPEDDVLHRVTYLGLALTFVTVAIALQLKASYLTVAWAAEGAVLVWSGVVVRERRVRAYGLAVLAVAALKALCYDLPPLDEPVRLLDNLRLLSGMAIVAAAAVSAGSLVRVRRDLSAVEETAVPGLAGLANLYALVFLSVGIWQHLEATLPLAGRENAQQLALSVCWCMYALAGMSVGIWRRARAARLFALGLLFVSVVKVFLYDLRYLEQPYRIISFLGLGLILLVVSLLYTRFEERLK